MRPASVHVVPLQRAAMWCAVVAVLVAACAGLGWLAGAQAAHGRIWGCFAGNELHRAVEAVFLRGNQYQRLGYCLAHATGAYNKPHN